MMMKKKNLQMLLICGALLVTACKSKSKEEQQSGYRMEGDTVRTRLSTQKAAMNLGMNVMVLDVNQGAWKLET